MPSSELVVATYSKTLLFYQQQMIILKKTLKKTWFHNCDPNLMEICVWTGKCMALFCSNWALKVFFFTTGHIHSFLVFTHTHTHSCTVTDWCISNCHLPKDIAIVYWGSLAYSYQLLYATEPQPPTLTARSKLFKHS